MTIILWSRSSMMWNFKIWKLANQYYFSRLYILKMISWLHDFQTQPIHIMLICEFFIPFRRNLNKFKTKLIFRRRKRRLREMAGITWKHLKWLKKRKMIWWFSIWGKQWILNDFIKIMIQCHYLSFSK